MSHGPRPQAPGPRPQAPGPRPQGLVVQLLSEWHLNSLSVYSASWVRVGITAILPTKSKEFDRKFLALHVHYICHKLLFWSLKWLSPLVPGLNVNAQGWCQSVNQKSEILRFFTHMLTLTVTTEYDSYDKCSQQSLTGGLFCLPIYAACWLRINQAIS